MAGLLREITDVVRETVGDDLAMLVLFGSYARGDWVDDEYTEQGITYTYQSDFDLLLVTEKRSSGTQRGAASLASMIRRRVERKGILKPITSVIVVGVNRLNKLIERGNYFLTDIKKEGVLLYDNGRHKLARRRRLDPKERQKYSEEDYRQWFKSAKGFYKMFEAAFAMREYKIAAFQLHQAAERAYHAITLTFTRYKAKTHDLERLSLQAGNLHADFFTVFPLATEREKRLFDLLKRAYIDARYKHDYKITKGELEYLATRVRKLHRLTKRICREKIRNFARAE